MPLFKVGTVGRCASSELEEQRLRQDFAESIEEIPACLCNSAVLLLPQERRPMVSEDDVSLHRYVRYLNMATCF